MKSLYENLWGNLYLFVFEQNDDGTFKYVRSIDIQNSTDQYIKVKNAVRIQISTFNIYYIEIHNRDRRTIHLSKTIGGDEKICEVEWKERLTNSAIISILGKGYFIQTEKRFIVHRIRVFGVDKKWENLQIRSIRTLIDGNDGGYLTKELPISHHFRKDLKEKLKKLDSLLTLITEYDEQIFVFPDTIACIKITRDIKTIYLTTPYQGTSGSTYIIKQKTRKSAESYLSVLNKYSETYFSVHKNYIVNFQCQISRSSKWNYLRIYYAKGLYLNVPISSNSEKRKKVKNIIPNLGIFDNKAENNKLRLLSSIHKQEYAP